ncbi:preprotein translocase subunit SecG [Candidatus Wolfebacteria bacterium]|nr:preprotein translocase subunit SecG [Candidatus Wolfebacteria bacterium]
MFISIVQIIVSVLLIALILLQERSSGASSIFGGVEGEVYHQRRGLERVIFFATVVLSLIFVGLSLFNIVGQSF